MSFKSPEPIILAAALLLLIGGAGYWAYSFPERAAIVGFHSMDPAGKPSKPLKAEDLDAKLVVWNSPVLWNEPANKRQLFDSEEYLFYPSAYPGGDYIKRNDPNALTPSGVLIRWEKENQLDFQDSGVDRADPDGDGFSNIVEYKNEPVGVRIKAADCDGTKSTNPHDPKSHPDYLARLRLQKYEATSFHIQFRGYQQLNGTYVFQIFLKDVPSDKQPPLKKTGDQLGFEGYVIGAFTLKIVEELDPATKQKVQKDRSTLELDRPDIGLKVIVPFREEVDSPESTADFVMLMPSDADKVIKISQGKILTIHYMPDRHFLLLEANDNGAKIQDTQSKQEYHILKLDQAEWDEVPAQQNK